MKNMKEYWKAYRERNKEKLKTYKKAYFQKNKEKRKAYNAAARLKNKGKYNEYHKIYLKSHPDRNRYKSAKYTYTKLRRAPLWLTKEQYSLIRAYYTEAMRLSSGDTKYYVGHIVPIQGKIVSGLHVPWNLQILSSVESVEKRSAFNWLEYKKKYLTNTNK